MIGGSLAATLASRTALRAALAVGALPALSGTLAALAGAALGGELAGDHLHPGLEIAAGNLGDGAVGVAGGDLHRLGLAILAEDIDGLLCAAAHRRGFLRSGTRTATAATRHER